ncbi:MAG: T9SS type A sorting domain-containing protein, partial [candidate division WOR-3 bacterium]
AYDCYVSGIYVYVADYYTGLVILNVSDPSNPIFVATCNLPSYAYGVYVSGNYAFMAQYFAGLWIIDVSEPSNPRVVGSYNTDAARDVYVSGNYAYLADGSTLRMIDISEPTSPSERAHYTTPSNATCVFPHSYIYVACAEAGVQIYESSIVQTEENHLFFNIISSLSMPNPIRDNIDLFLPEQARHIEIIELYSLLGEKIKSWKLPSAIMQNLSLPVKGIAPGIYFLKLKNKVFKVIILK